jgi:hypothetical protein
MMVTKQEIDNYFTNNYSKILLAIGKTKSKYNTMGNWEPDELLTDTYQHLLDNQNKIEDNNQIEAFTMRYMSNQVKWANSKINRLHRQEKITYEETINHQLIDDESDLMDKIKLEQDFNDKRAILFNFYQQLPTKQEKILFEVIFVKGIKTVKALSSHFNINKNYIQTMKKKLFDELKQYITTINN